LIPDAGSRTASGRVDDEQLNATVEEVDVARRKKSREQKKREKQARLLRREDRWWEPFQKVIRLLPLTSD